MPKRRVFISYHHANEQTVVDEFVRKYSATYDVFTDQSIERAANSSDVDYLARVCREAILGTSLTILIVGRETGGRKFVDWELHYTLEKQHGLLGLLAPGLPDTSAWLPDRFRDNTKTGYALYKYMPASAYQLQLLIEEAVAKKAALIDNSRAQMPFNRSR